MVDKLFTATKAFITNSSGEVLILRESTDYEEGANAGKWDVVGGRVEPGQRFDESLQREIREETGLKAEIGDPFHTGEWRPKVKDEKWQIIGTYFECKANSEEVELSEDHDKFAWINPEKHTEYNLIGDLEKVFEKFLEKRKQTIAAGKAVIINKDGEILIMKRSVDETHLQEFWDVPGGSLEHGEEPKKALERETKEEAGINIEVMEPVNTWTYMHSNEAHRFGATYLCRPESTDIELGEEHIEHKWVKPEDLEEAQIYDELKEGIKKAHRKWSEKQ